MADLLKFCEELEEKSSAGAWLTVRHPLTNEPFGGAQRPARIRLAGTFSRQIADHDRVLQARRRDEVARTGKTIPDSDEVTEREIELYAAATLEWENLEEDGRPMSCSPANCKRLYRHKWLRNQILLFMAEGLNFGLKGEAAEAYAEAGPVASDPVAYAAETEKKSEPGRSGDSDSPTAEPTEATLTRAS